MLILNFRSIGRISVKIRQQNVFLFLLLFISQSVFARLGDGIEISKMKFNARSEVGIGYDDNILLERSGQIEDLFYHVRPYIDFEAPFTPEDKFYISADADIYRFQDYSSEDSESYVFLAGYNFAIRDFYGILLEEYIRPQDRDGILFTNKIERTNNIPSILLGFDFNRLALEALYKKSFNRYTESIYARDEYDEDLFAFSAYWHAFTKTDLLLEYNYGKMTYISENRDGEYDQIRVGVKGQITSKITGTMKAGYQDRTYVNSDENYKGLVYEADTVWKISESKSVDIKFIRGAKESLIYGNDFYKLNRFAIEFKHEAAVRGILYGIGGFYENDKFPFTYSSTLREDDVFEVAMKLGYKFSNWLTVQGRYKLLDRDSNYDSQDYTQNLYTLFATLQL